MVDTACCLLSAVRLPLALSRRTPSFGVGQPTIGRPFYGQAKGQLRLTWRPSAGSPQQRRISVRVVSEGMLVNTSRREDGRRQTALFPKARGFRRLTAPGFKPPSGFALGGSDSAHRAGWFRGSYNCRLRWRWWAPLHNERRHDDKTVKPPWRAMEMHPFCRLSATSSPEGQILAALCFEVLMRPKAEQRANFPLRGGKGTGFVGERNDLRIQ